jgi:hypothetical protein
VTEPDEAPWPDVNAYWYAEMTRLRVGYRIRVTNGVLVESGFLVESGTRWALTRRGAERRGRRRAAARNREPQWERV